MGCSSSTQTHILPANKPPAKPVETNGPKKTDLEANDDIETIPDQTKLIPPTESEPNGIPPGEEQIEAEEAIEYDGAETSEATAQDAYLPAEEDPEQAEDLTEEGEVEEATEAGLHEEIESDEPETKEDETEHSADAAEPEMDTADGEE